MFAKYSAFFFSFLKQKHSVNLKIQSGPAQDLSKISTTINPDDVRHALTVYALIWLTAPAHLIPLLLVLFFLRIFSAWFIASPKNYSQLMYGFLAHRGQSWLSSSLIPSTSLICNTDSSALSPLYGPQLNYTFHWYPVYWMVSSFNGQDRLPNLSYIWLFPL